MPRSKPTPTLAELRRLAKRKGLELRYDRGKMDCYTPGPISGIACCAHHATRECWSSLTKEQACKVLFAALSALPDPEGGKR